MKSKQSKLSGRGGRRAGAGRKPKAAGAALNDADDVFPAAAGAMVKALASASQSDFVMAMAVLGADIDEVRNALGLSREGFVKNFGRLFEAKAAR
jgi:hypothetical protein